MTHLMSYTVKHVGTFQLRVPELKSEDGQQHSRLALEFDIAEFNREMTPLITDALSRGLRLPATLPPSYESDFMTVWVNIHRLLPRNYSDEQLMDWVKRSIERALEQLTFNVNQHLAAQAKRADITTAVPAATAPDDLLDLIARDAINLPNLIARDRKPPYVNRPRR